VYSRNNPVNVTDQNGKDPPNDKPPTPGRVSFMAGVQINAVAKDDETTEITEYSLDTGSGIVCTPDGSSLPTLQFNKDTNSWEPALLNGSVYTLTEEKPGFFQRQVNRFTGLVGLVFNGLEAYAGGAIIAGTDGLA